MVKRPYEKTMMFTTGTNAPILQVLTERFWFQVLNTWISRVVVLDFTRYEIRLVF